MKLKNKHIGRTLRYLTFFTSVVTTMVFFQNCDQNSFKTLSLNGKSLSQNLNSELNLPSDNEESPGIFDIPQADEDNDSMNILPTASTSTTGKIYYVSTTGNNGNTGSVSQPFATVAYAVNKMVAGDTTYVRGGLYKESMIKFKRSGTQSAPIKLLNYPQELPIIDFGVNGDRSKSDYRVVFESENGTNKAIGWITLEGFEIRNGYNGVKYYNLHNSLFRKNHIHHHVSQGIKGNGSYRVTIDRNKIHNNGDFAGCLNGDLSENGAGTTTVCSQQHGIYIDGQSLTITNNIIYHNLCLGITQNGNVPYSSTAHAGPEFAGAQNWLIANNTFAYQYYCPAISVWGSRTSNSKIINNIFYENSSSRSNSAVNAISLFSSNPAKGIVINNNISYATGSGGTVFISDGYNTYTENIHYTQSGNIVNSLNPNFVNAPATLPSSPNFALKANSPAIDRGLNLTSILSTRTSFNGVLRPRGNSYDIGAYEY